MHTTIDRQLLSLNPSHCKIRVLLTNSCPHKCSWCHMEGDKRGSTFITEELFYSVLYSLPSDKRKTITLVLSGGEPLIHPEVETFVQEASKAGFKSVHLVSNGYAPDILNRVAEYLDRLKIHLESYDPKFYRSIHKVPIDRVKKSLALLKHHSNKVLIEAPVNRLFDIAPLLVINNEKRFNVKLLEIKPEDGLSYPSFDSIVEHVMNCGYSRISNHDDFTYTYVLGSHIVYVSRKRNSGGGNIFIDSSGYIYNSLNTGKSHSLLQVA